MDNSVIVSLRDIVVEFDGQRILDGLNLDIHDKEFVTLLGSSGCGKTTTLRLIAGFLEPNSGKVLLKGQDITGVPPYKRPVNTVFQKYALFPHLNVFENVAFGLRLKKMDEETIRRKVRNMLEVVGLKGFERRSISQMSGVSGITKTPPSLFFPMWFAIFARVLVGAKPIPHGIPIFFSIRARAANAYSYMSDLLGGKTKASSIEYCSISPNTSPSTHISRFDISAYSSKLLDFRMIPSCRTRGRN